MVAMMLVTMTNNSKIQAVDGTINLNENKVNRNTIMYSVCHVSRITVQWCSTQGNKNVEKNIISSVFTLHKNICFYQAPPIDRKSSFLIGMPISNVFIV